MRKNPSLKKKTRAKPNKIAEPPPFRPFAKLAKRGVAKPSATPPRPAPIEEEEPALFREEEGLDESFAAHAGDVRPLTARPKRIPKTAASGAEEASSAGVVGARSRNVSKKATDDTDEPSRTRLHAIVTDAIRFEVTDDGRSLDGRRTDVDPRELRRLRTARYAVDGQLDLHGLRAAEARLEVTRFLKKRAVEGDKAVMIVHAKGSHSPRGDAVLRGEIGAWLSQGSAARHVLAFASVIDRAGESGALFVLLTR